MEPLVKGGQGRTENETRGDAKSLFWIVVAGLLLVAFFATLNWFGLLL